LLNESFGLSLGIIGIWTAMFALDKDSSKGSLHTFSRVRGKITTRFLAFGESFCAHLCIIRFRTLLKITFKSRFVPREGLEIFTKKNGFVTATKLGTTNKFIVAATENFSAVTKCFVDGTKHFVVVTKYFCCPYFN